MFKGSLLNCAILAWFAWLSCDLYLLEMKQRNDGFAGCWVRFTCRWKVGYVWFDVSCQLSSASEPIQLRIPLLWYHWLAMTHIGVQAVLMISEYIPFNIYNSLNSVTLVVFALY